jgi:hypothetical protein
MKFLRREIIKMKLNQFCKRNHDNAAGTTMSCALFQKVFQLPDIGLFHQVLSPQVYQSA